MALAALLLPAGTAAFGFDDVALRAKHPAARSSRRSASNLPEELRGLTYDQYRDIRFKPERAWWRSARLHFGLERIPAVTGKLWWLAPVVGALIAAAPSRARAGVVDRDLPLAGVPRAAVAAPDAAGG